MIYGWDSVYIVGGIFGCRLWYRAKLWGGIIHLACWSFGGISGCDLVLIGLVMCLVSVSVRWGENCKVVYTTVLTFWSLVYLDKFFSVNRLFLPTQVLCMSEMSKIGCDLAWWYLDICKAINTHCWIYGTYYAMMNNIWYCYNNVLFFCYKLSVSIQGACVCYCSDSLISQ